MARTPKPWYRKFTKTWYVTIDGEQVNLGKNKKEAMRKFHELMASPQQKLTDAYLVVILDKFLEYTQGGRSPKTYRWYKDYLESFAKKYPNMLVADLKPFHVDEWASEGKAKRAKITAVKRAINWAAKRGYIQSNPIAGLERPEVGHREEFIKPDDFQNLINHIKDECFRDLLEFSWETGSRPQEAKEVCALHVNLQDCYFVLPVSEAKRKREQRIVYLTDKAIEILKRNWRTEGPILRNSWGEPWTANAVRCRFKRLEDKIGKRYCQYLFRHSWITRKLIAGVPTHTVALLAGHRDSRMIDKHYSKVALDHKYMLEQARRDVKSSNDED